MFLFRELLCLRDCVGPRFTRILNIPYTSPYTRPYTSPNTSPYSGSNPSHSYPSLSSLSLTYPCTSTSSPGSTTIKLSGVLTSFKHRTFKTRYLSIFLSIHLSNHLSSHLSIFLSIHLSINLSLYQSMYHSIHLSNYPGVLNSPSSIIGHLKLGTIYLSILSIYPSAKDR